VVDHRDRRLGRVSKQASRSVNYDLGRYPKANEDEEDELADDFGETEPTGRNGTIDTQHRRETPVVVQRRTTGSSYERQSLDATRNATSSQNRNKGKGRALVMTPSESEGDLMPDYQG
jgi:hypothetical protein